MNLTFNYFDSRESLPPEELNYICELDRNHFPFPWTNSAWQELFQTNQQLLIIAQTEDEIVGFALYNISSVDSFAHLLKIVIDKNHRSRGFGKEILKASIQYLNEFMDITNFYLEVETSNDRAIKLYEAIGFKNIHTKKSFYSNGHDAIIMTTKAINI